VAHSVRTIPLLPLSPVWMKAAVVGGIWASLEIIIGSFLHNLRLPLSGTILAVISVYLLVAFVQIWGDKGLIWRAGLICALMKSVSPSAVIIGPMTGIMLEAILLELIILLFGRNLFGYLVGGAAAVLSSLAHKLITLLILYGFDLVRILSGLYMFSVKQVKLESADPAILIAIIAGLYILAGFVGAAGGYMAGRAYLNSKSTSGNTVKHELQPGNTLFNYTTGQKYSLLILSLNLASIVICLMLLNSGYFLLAVTTSVIYVGFCIAYYRQALNRLRKPAIWIQFILITLVSAFLWNKLSGDSLFDMEGMAAGLKMIWRAIIVIIGFAAISVEMKNPLIRSVLYNRGFASLYQSVSLSFSALPSIIAQLPTVKELFTNHKISFGNLFRIAESLLPAFENDHTKRPEIFILTGDRMQGKTKLLKEIVAILKNRGVFVSGFVSEGIDAQGKRTGFILKDIKTDEAVELCNVVNKFGGPVQGRYFFNPAAILKGNEILGSANSGGTGAIVIDEVGPMEIGGNGWYSAIEMLCGTSRDVQIWTVRRSIADKATRRWSTGNIHIVDIATAQPLETAKLIISAISDNLQRKNRVTGQK